MVDYHRIRFHRRIAHPAPLVRVDGENEGLEEKSAIQRDGVQVNRLGRIRDGCLPGDGKVLEPGLVSARASVKGEYELTLGDLLEDDTRILNRSHRCVCVEDETRGWRVHASIDDVCGTLRAGVVSDPSVKSLYRILSNRERPAGKY